MKSDGLIPCNLLIKLKSKFIQEMGRKEEETDDIHSAEAGKEEIRAHSNNNINNNISSSNSVGRSRRWSFREAALSFRSSLSRGDGEERDRERNDEEEELKWAAIERLPTYDRLRTSLFFQYQHIDDQSSTRGEKGENQGRVPVDVGRLGAMERRLFIENLIKHIEKDNLRLLQNQRLRIDRYALSTLPNLSFHGMFNFIFTCVFQTFLFILIV